MLWGWSLALGSLAQVCAATIHSTSVATFTGYVIVLLGTMLSLLIR